MTQSQIAYREYLESDHWRSLRLEAFRVHGRHCCKCPARNVRLDVHHLVYRWPWESCTVDDVRPICRRCHEKEHGILPAREQRTIHRRHRRRNGWLRRWRLVGKQKARFRRGRKRNLGPLNKPKKWWPGIYEGKPPGAALLEVGTTIRRGRFPGQNKTPESMNVKINHHH